MGILKKAIWYSFISYIILSILLLILHSRQEVNYPVLITNLFVAAFFFVTLLLQIETAKFDKKKMVLVISLYSIIVVFIYNFMFYYSSGSFFEFNAVDSYTYHDYAISLKRLDFYERIKTIQMGFGRLNFDDLGFPFYLSIVYEIIESNILVNFLNVILVVTTAYLLFKISNTILSVKAAYLSSLIYSLSSYTVYFEASGLKEILMNFIIVTSFFGFYKFIFVKNKLWLVFAFLSSLSLLFFRIPLVLFLFGSFGSYYLFITQKKISNYILMIIVLVSGYYLYDTTEIYLQRYLTTYADIVYYKVSASSFQGLPAQLVTIISFIVGFIGPFPTLIPFNNSENISFYASGLLLKVFISIPFLLGMLFIVKHKVSVLMPIVIFCFIEIASISFLWESFEVRKVFPHFPFIFIIAVYYLENMRSIKVKNMMNFSFLAFFTAIFVWNYLRF